GVAGDDGVSLGGQVDTSPGGDNGLDLSADLSLNAGRPTDHGGGQRPQGEIAVSLEFGGAPAPAAGLGLAGNNSVELRGQASPDAGGVSDQSLGARASLHTGPGSSASISIGRSESDIDLAAAFDLPGGLDGRVAPDRPGQSEGTSGADPRGMGPSKRPAGTDG